jgi:AraC-like DNA-binding protein
VRYAEHPIPPALDGLVTAIWALDGERDAENRVTQDATPDGCIELIRRLRGRSWWDGEQPDLFVTGLSEAPVRFSMSGDAAFVGVRMWPWAWAAIGGTPAPTFAGRWIAIEPGSQAGAILVDPARTAETMTRALDGHRPGAIADAVLRESSVAGIVARSGVAHRSVQRWFASAVGMPPRRYLRLIRFRAAMLDFAGPPGTLADHASANGFADQAHMARDFRALAGIPPSQARSRAVGPFLP